jgi:hypothetical protein
MFFTKPTFRFFVLALLAASGNAQSPPSPQAPSPAATLQRRMAKVLDPGTGVWTAQQIATMSQLRDAALADDYAFLELRHLSNNIGPRLSGSAQAAQAVAYVAAEMRALGATGGRRRSRRILTYLDTSVVVRRKSRQALVTGSMAVPRIASI